MKTVFENTYGFGREEVRLDNWRLNPWSRWSFQNLGELVPVSQIVAPPGGSESSAVDSAALLARSVSLEGVSRSVSDFLAESSTDALVVMKNGLFIADYFAPYCDPRRPHIIFSISKSLTALLAGIAQADGLLDPNAPVTTYVPEMAGSAYGDATVQQVLDMRVDLDFEEAYLDPESAFARYRRATLWNPPLAGKPVETLLEFIATLQKSGAGHGGVFHYQSPNSDLLGTIVERATGRRFANYASEQLWAPIGLRRSGLITVDAIGTPRSAGGMAMSARDLARIGEMMRNGGRANGRQIVPEAWVQDTINGGDRDAWANGDFSQLLAKGSYRNKWYQSGFDSGAFLGIGIHGQWLYVNPPAGVVIVKQSSQPIPVDDRMDQLCLRFFEQVAAMV